MAKSKLTLVEAVTLLFILGFIAFWGVVAFAALHFIAKLW